MVRITLTENNGAFELYAKGHAGYAKKGEDIVCASVSILLFTLIESIDENDLARKPVVVQREGNTFIRLVPKFENRGKIRGVFDVISNGFLLLQENFQKNVKFCRFGG